MSNKAGKRYSKEFKRDAVALARSSSKTVTEVARDLGVSPEGLRSWVKQDRVDRGEGSPGELTSAEREELRRLRRQNLEQQKTIEVLKEVSMRALRAGTGARYESGAPSGAAGRGVDAPSALVTACRGRFDHRSGVVRQTSVSRGAASPQKSMTLGPEEPLTAAASAYLRLLNW